MLYNKDNILPLLSSGCSFDTADESFSPMYSNTGIASNGRGGLSLYAHYNRKTRALFTELTDRHGEINTALSSMTRLVCGNERLTVTCYDTDCFIIETKDGKLSLFGETGEGTTGVWTEKAGETVFIKGYSKNTDARDPDEYVPFAVAVAVKEGIIENGSDRITAVNKNGSVKVNICVRLLETDLDEMEKKVSVNLTPAEAIKASESFIKENLKDLSLEIPTEKEAKIVCKALKSLIFNTAKAPGRLKRHLSAFPSRGGYPTHFMWDTCFQNLAYELMSNDLAKEFLLQFASCVREDGKLEQFICSTWGRPHDTQPALAGWAAKRLYSRTKDRIFAERMFEFLEKNNRWWLSSRMTRFGLVFCPSGLETGQDNSPRFDNGPTIATDMNSFLFDQLGAAAFFARELGNKDRELYWSHEQKKLGDSIIKHLYDPVDNIFYDISPESGEKIKLVSCASVMPLRFGVPLDGNRKKEMIEKYLLGKDYFFGDIPMPSVAYCESCYDHADWWRGPMWMPTARLMLDILKDSGYSEQYKTAFDRIYKAVLDDGNMRELFDSKTGKGMGRYEQGWTAAVFISMLKEKENM